MIAQPSTPLTRKPKTTHTPSILQVIFGILAIILLISGSLLLGMAGFLRRDDPLSDPVGILQWSASLAFAALLVVPSVFYAYRRISTGAKTEPIPGSRRMNWVLISSLLLLTMPVILWLGNTVSTDPDLAWIFLPPLHVLAIALPVFWLVSLALRGLPTRSRQRAWGVFDVGLVLGPGLVLLLETLAAIGLFVLAMLYVFSQPELMEELNSLALSLRTASEDPIEILRLLEPYLTHPAFLTIALVFVAAIVPLIEELLKPIGVWFLAGTRLSPAEGFAAGILSGAGFALFENLALASGGSDWALATTTRAGTAVVHIFTAALMGWALALAWTKRRYVTLLFTYILAVFIHSLWNGVALLGMATYPMIPASIQRFSGAALTGLLVIIFILFTLLMTFNSRLRQREHAQAEPTGLLEPEDKDDSPLVR